MANPQNIGWIKLYRSLMDKAFYGKDSEMVHLWVHLLMKASFSQDKEEYLGVLPYKCAPGEFTTGRRQLALETGINASKVERCLTYFEKIEQQIEQRKTRQNRLIIIKNWQQYQQSEPQNEPQVNHSRTTSEPQVNTLKERKNVRRKECKEVKERKNILSGRLDAVPYKKIIDHLNSKIGSNFQHTTKETRRLIDARWNSGFRLEDFYYVIDIKAHNWLNDEKMRPFLRPCTLFGTKFESYRNERPKCKQPGLLKFLQKEGVFDEQE